MGAAGFVLSCLGVALLAGLTVGCTPSSFIARKALEAPNRAPEFVKPEARVALRWPAGVIERFPSGTNVVGNPPAPLRWLRVDAATYAMSVTSTVERHGGRVTSSLGFTFRLPDVGLPPARPSRGTVVLLHGYGVDLETLFPWAVYLGEAGWRSVLVDLRGHGLSGGRQVTFGLMETNDLRELRVQLEQAGVIEGPVAALGHSLGGAVALRWAAIDPEVRGVVAFGPPAAFGESMVRVRDEYARWVPRRWVRHAAARVPRLLEVDPVALDAWAALEARPVLGYLVAGASDRVTPPEDSARLRPLLAPGSEFLVVEGVSHETLPYWFEDHGGRVLEWLDRWVAGSLQARQ